MDPTRATLNIQFAGPTAKEHKAKLLEESTMEEKSNVEFHLANSHDLDEVHIDMADEENAGGVEMEDTATTSLSSDNATKDKEKKSKRDDDVDYVAIARGLSSQEKKLKFSRLLKQSAPEKHILCLGVLFTFLGSISYLATPVLMGSMLDAVSSSMDAPPDIEGRPTQIFCDLSPIGCETDKGLLKTAVIALFCISILSAGFAFGKWFALEVAGERVVARLRKQLFQSILSQEVGMFDVTKTGELVNRLSTDTTILKSACTSQVAQTLQSIVQVIISVLYVLYLSWKLTLIVLSVLPVVIIVGRFYGQYYRKQSKINQDRLAEATTVAQESIALVRTVKSFSQEQYQQSLYDAAIHLTYKQGVKMAFANGIWMAFFSIMANVGIGAVVWYGASQVIDGHMNPGDLATYVLLTIQIGFSFGSFISLYSTIMKALGASERVFQLIDRESAIPSSGGDMFVNYDQAQKNQTEAAQRTNSTNTTAGTTNGTEKVSDLCGLVELKNVTFAYPSRKEMVVLKNLNLSVEPGTITSLVGESGGGKSTVAKLLMRFYDPVSGEITVDGKDIRKYDLRWLHKQIGFVSQEPVLFAATIRENIIYGVQDADTQISDERIMDAAKKANAHDFIMSFPEKYDTVVGERGIRLSGGQKQRIAIARAILMNPQILLLDEATSALDSESEYLVQQALDRIMVGRSVLVIAHRLSTVKNAHQVVVIEKGKVVEIGTHDELIQKEGSYAKLVKRQLFAT